MGGGPTAEGGQVPVRSYRDLVAWQKAMDLAELVYSATKAFPKDELYGLTSQLRRAAVSVPSNIAEGQGRNTTRDFRNHLSIAYGSLQEVETQSLLSHRLGFLPRENLQTILEMTSEVARLINGLSSSLLKKAGYSYSLTSTSLTTDHSSLTTDHSSHITDHRPLSTSSSSSLPTDHCPLTTSFSPLLTDFPTKESLRKALPGLILRHNLHGVDIDPRCAQIAQLALWMRAQKAYQDFGILRSERPAIRRSNIVIAEPMPGEQDILAEFVGTLGNPTLEARFRSIAQSMNLAGDLGLLLRLEKHVQSEKDYQMDVFEPGDDAIRNSLEAFLTGATVRQQARKRLFTEDAVQGLGLVELAEKRYDVVLMNPPFGAGSLRAKKEFEKAYPRTKNDVYAAFVERGIQLLHPRGRLGAITSRTGFFLSSFQKWREEIILKEAPPVVFADLGYGVLDSAMVETAAYCLEVKA